MKPHKYDSRIVEEVENEEEPNVTVKSTYKDADNALSWLYNYFENIKNFSSDDLINLNYIKNKLPIINECNINQPKINNFFKFDKITS